MNQDHFHSEVQKIVDEDHAAVIVYNTPSTERATILEFLQSISWAYSKAIRTGCIPNITRDQYVWRRWNQRSR